MSLAEKMQKTKALHDSTYKSEEILSKRLWKPYDRTVKDLEGEVTMEFRKVLDKIGPIPIPNSEENDAAIIDSFHVSYDPNHNQFYISIEAIKTPKGVASNDNQTHCAHGLMDLITKCGSEHPLITEFNKNYSIGHIMDLNNYCGHK